MIDEYFHQFEGTGNETHGETMVRPNPGHHFYENGKSRSELLEDHLGVGLSYFKQRALELGEHGKAARIVAHDEEAGFESYEDDREGGGGYGGGYQEQL